MCSRLFLDAETAYAVGPQIYGRSVERVFVEVNPPKGVDEEPL